MKTKLLISSALVLMGTSATAGSLDDALKTFEDNPGYSSPVATYMGTLLNSGWVRSAKINKGFGFGMGLDFNLAFLAQEDTEYTFDRATECETLKGSAFKPSGDCENSFTYTVPTIFGGSSSESYENYVINKRGENYFIEVTDDGSANEGIVSEDGVLGLPNWFFLPTAYVSFQMEHTEAKIRTMYLPVNLAGHEFSYGLFALGLQHDINHYSGYKWPVDVSVVANWSMWGVSYTNENYTGTLELDGLVQNYGVVAGKQWGPLEVTGEMGWELSSFDASGEMKHNEDSDKDVSPGVTVDGRNGFRASLNLTLHFNSYKLFGSQSLGAQRGNTFNFINYHKDGAK